MSQSIPHARTAIGRQLAGLVQNLRKSDKQSHRAMTDLFVALDDLQVVLSFDLVPALVECIRGADELTQGNAWRCLGAIVGVGARARDAVLRAMPDEGHVELCDAVAALGRSGATPATAVDRVIECIADQPGDAARALISARDSLNTTQVGRALAALKEHGRESRWSCGARLALDPHDEDAFDGLKSAIVGDSRTDAVGAVSVLIAIPAEGTLVQTLRDLALASPDDFVRTMAEQHLWPRT